ncbi:MAG: type II toxin-antitoxin system Phd/YefM family antitoxin [Dehalococcoidia bacterium]
MEPARLTTNSDSELARRLKVASVTTGYLDVVTGEALRILDNRTLAYYSIRTKRQDRRPGEAGGMRGQEPMTQTMKVSEARDQFSRLLNQVYRQEKRVLVEKSGIPVAAIVSAADLTRLQQLEGRRNTDFAALDAFGKAFRDVPDDELEREVASAVAEARAELRAERTPST